MHMVAELLWSLVLWLCFIAMSVKGYAYKVVRCDLIHEICKVHIQGDFFQLQNFL